MSTINTSVYGSALHSKPAGSGQCPFVVDKNLREAAVGTDSGHSTAAVTCLLEGGLMRL